MNLHTRQVHCPPPALAICYCAGGNMRQHVPSRAVLLVQSCLVPVAAGVVTEGTQDLLQLLKAHLL